MPASTCSSILLMTFLLQLSISPTNGRLQLHRQPPRWIADFSCDGDQDLDTPYNRQICSRAFTHDTWLQALRKVHSWLWEKWQVMQMLPARYRPVCATPQQPGVIPKHLMPDIEKLIPGLFPSLALVPRKRPAMEMHSNCLHNDDMCSGDSLMSILLTRPKHRKTASVITEMGCSCIQPHWLDTHEHLVSFLDLYGPLHECTEWDRQNRLWAKGRVLHRSEYMPGHKFYHGSVHMLPYQGNLQAFQAAIHLQGFPPGMDYLIADMLAFEDRLCVVYCLCWWACEVQVYVNVFQLLARKHIIGWGRGGWSTAGSFGTMKLYQALVWHYIMEFTGMTSCHPTAYLPDWYDTCSCW